MDGKVTRHIWDGKNISIDMVDGVVRDKYIRGVSLLAAVNSSNIKTTYQYNAHGDVVRLTNSSGNVTWKYDYDAFGVEREIAGQNAENDTNPFRYCGEYFDKETGSIYLRARYYNPKIGRFITQDPINDGLNWYTYCNNNPVKWIDPTGLRSAADAVALDNGTLSRAQDDYISLLTDLYNAAKGNPFLQNKFHLLANEVRKSTYAPNLEIYDYDQYDFSHGGTYDYSQDSSKYFYFEVSYREKNRTGEIGRASCRERV